MTILLFLVALSLSAVAAWYAIAGLVAIFAASAGPIMIMGGLLEASKLVVASWLYRSWKDIPSLMKVYFMTALVVLMMLTSMGIFGFLSKAHLDQAVPTGDVAAQVALIDEKLTIQKENINAARKTITQLDTIADQAISRTEDARGIERANQIRRSQASERARLIAEISAAQTEIARLNKEKEPIAKDLRKIEAEVGPIKYIAALIYGDNPDQNLLESAVRIVTLLIVFVFDPLAVLMLVAANWQYKRDLGAISQVEVSPKVESAEQKPILDDVEVEEIELPEITIEEVNKEQEPEQPRQQKKRIEYDSAGRRITPPLEEELHPQSKTSSFLNKVEQSLKS